MSSIIARLGLASLTCVAGIGAFAIVNDSPTSEVQAGVLGPATASAERGFARFAPPHTETPALAACVALDAELKFLQAVEQHMWETWLASHPDMGGVAYQLGGRWTPGAQGDPITLRWSLVPDGLFIPSGIGEPSSVSTLQAELITVFGSVAAGKAKIQAVFDRWDELTGLNFTAVSDDGAFWGAGGSSQRGDLRIGGHNFGFTDVLAYAAYPNDGDIVMNTSVNWAQPGGDYEFFRNVLAHESGHATGLKHNCPQSFTKLMEPSATVGYDGPQHDDVRGNQRHYGDRLEANNSFGTASFVGAGTLITVDGLSIDDNSDADFFKFTVNDPGQKVTIKAKPIGYIYLQAPQESDGDCPAGTQINTINIHNLNVTLYSPTQAVLATDDTSPIGFTEYLSDYELPGTGTFAAKIAGGAANDIQLYDLEIIVEPIEVTPPPCPADLNGDGSVTGLDLAALLGVWTGAASYPGCPPHTAHDLNQDCKVNGLDLAALLAAWGVCK